MNSFRTIEQTIVHAYLNFQADISPARFSSTQAQDSSSTPNSMPPLIPSSSEEINEIYKVPCDLTSDLERSTLYLLITMNNPTNQLLSYESDTITQANSNYFSLPTGSTLEEIKHNPVIVKRENRGDECSKQFPQTTGFDVSKHFVQRSKDGEDVDAVNSNYTYFQEFFRSNLTKVDSREHCVISWDLKDILMIRDLCDVKQFAP